MDDPRYLVLPMSNLGVNTTGIRTGEEGAIQYAIDASLKDTGTAHGVYLQDGEVFKLIGIAYDGKFKLAEDTETEA